MTSRERVQKAVNFQVPDRVPIDLGGMKASGIAAGAYHRLKKLLGIHGATKVSDLRFMIAAVESEVLRRFHVDVVPLDLSCIAAAVRPDNEWIPRTLFDQTPVLLPPGTAIREEKDGSWVLLNEDGSASSFRMPPGGYYFDDTTFNRGGKIDPAQFNPQTDIPDESLRLMADYAGSLYRSTDFALLGWGFGVCFLGFCLRRVNQAVGDYCFAWGIASDDSGTQRGEFISPDLWAEMIKPHYTKLCDWVHRNTKMKTFFHCCGSIPHLIPHLIEAGVDILNPVQTSAAGMDPLWLKREFGRRIVFWGGGCDTQSVLPTATPDAVRSHVKERLEIFSPGGGYVFNQVHNIQANVPPENVAAMLDAAYDFGVP